MKLPLVVAGGGLAGAAAACLLARAGCRVVLLEREAGPTDKMCGEFISVEAQHYLRLLGLDPAALGAEPVSRVRLVQGAAAIEVALPFVALGLSRRRLDQALIDCAAANGAEIRRGCTITRLGREGALTLDIAGRDTIQADTVFLATGKHELRGAQRKPRTPPENLVGFKMYFCLTPAQHDALHGCVEVLMWPDGYGGLQNVEDGRSNLCLLTQQARLHAAGGDWHRLLDDLCRTQPHLARRLRDAAPLLAQPLSIFRVPYGFLHKPGAHDPAGLYRLGDQVAVIPSFTGDGMAIALHSAAVAVACYLQGSSAQVYHRRMRQDFAAQIARAAALYRLGRSAPGQAAMMWVARRYPAALRLATSLTRIPHHARAHHAATPAAG
jgi:flavin-dependent dehydrogenase